MKNCFILIFLTLLLTEVSAQDIIITREAQKIECRIAEVGEKQIKYRKTSDADGPLFVIEVRNVATVIYANGDVQAFEEQPDESLKPNGNTENAYYEYMLQRQQEAEQRKLAKQEAKEQRKKEKLEEEELHNQKMLQKKIYFQGMFEASGEAGFKRQKNGRQDYSTVPPDCFVAGGGVDAIFGFRTQNLINFFGFGVGLHVDMGGSVHEEDHYTDPGKTYTYHGVDNGGGNEGDIESVKFASNVFMPYFPIFVNDRIYLPTKRNINPFLDLSLGAYITIGNVDLNLHNPFGSSYDSKYQTNKGMLLAGMFSRFGVGMEYKRLVLGAGYQLLVDSRGEPNSSAYLKVGVRIGWVAPAKKQ